MVGTLTTIVLLLSARNRIHNSKSRFRQHPLTSNTTPLSRLNESSSRVTTCTRRILASQTQTRRLWLELGQLTSLNSTQPQPSNSHCGIKLKPRQGTVRKACMVPSRGKRNTLLRETGHPDLASVSEEGRGGASTLPELRTALAPLQGITQTPIQCTGHSISNDYKSSKVISIRKANRAYCEALSMQQCIPAPKGTAKRQIPRLNALQPPSWLLSPSPRVNPHYSSTPRWTPFHLRQVAVSSPTLASLW